MTLGERIAIQRKAKSLSQEELANILNVSRQAVYKWESDQSTPELEKLIAMTSIFEISLDELVKGEIPQNSEVVINVNSKKDRHFTSGIIFLVGGMIIMLIMSLLTGSFGGAIVGIPFIVCALLCFFTHKHTVLWCIWAFYVCIDLYIRYATGLAPGLIRHSFEWTYEMNYMRLAIAWVQFIVVLIMIAITVKAFENTELERNKKNYLRLVLGVLAFIVLYFLLPVLKLFGIGFLNSIWYPVICEGKSVLLIFIMVYVVRTVLGLFFYNRNK